MSDLKKKQLTIRNSTAEFLIFTSQAGGISKNAAIRKFRIVQQEGQYE